MFRQAAAAVRTRRAEWILCRLFSPVQRATGVRSRRIGAHGQGDPAIRMNRESFAEIQALVRNRAQ